MFTEKVVSEAALDIIKNEGVQKNAAGLIDKLLPYSGITKKAVDTYIKEIENSNLSPEAKVFYILNTKKTIKKLKNQSDIVKIAFDNAKEGTDFSAESKVDEEWLDRFMDSAGFVNADDIKLIWGKILAKEFENPGSTPSSMTRVLSEITPHLADCFRTICSMYIWVIPFKGDECLDKERVHVSLFVPYFKQQFDRFSNLGVNFSDLNELESMGVIKFNGISGYIERETSSTLVFDNNETLLVTDINNDELPVGNVLLTSVGAALRNITEIKTIDGYGEMVEEYLQFKRCTTEKNHGYIITKSDDTLEIKNKAHNETLLIVDVDNE